MEIFHYNMRCRTKDHLILENIYDQYDSNSYILYGCKIDKCHIDIGLRTINQYPLYWCYIFYMGKLY